MNNIKVSIITVCYNAEQTIEETIKSVINQTYRNIEYIIIDGASTDLTYQIINKYQPYVHTIVSEEDEGLYYAMNKGINYAKGDIIGILNSDDVYVEEAVSKVVEYYHKTGADIIYGNALWIGEEREGSTYRCDDIEELWYQMVIPHPATFVKAEVYKKYGKFNTKYKLAADYDLMLRFYSNSLRFGHLDEAITFFRSGGKSDQNPNICIEEAREIALCYIDRCNRKDYYLKKIHERYYKYYLGFFWNHNRKLIEKGIRNILNDHSMQQIVIWGTGQWGQRMRCTMQDINLKIDCFIDNDETKQGQAVYGIATRSPDFLKDYKGGVLIAVSKYTDEIMEQIRGINDHLFVLTLTDIVNYVLRGNELSKTKNSVKTKEK